MLFKVKHASGKVIEADRGMCDRLLARTDGKWTEVHEEETPKKERPAKKKTNKDEDTQSDGDT
jgi:hypothetical protein